MKHSLRNTVSVRQSLSNDPNNILDSFQTASNRLKHLKYTIRMPEKTSSGISWNTDKLYYHGLSSDPRPNSYPNRNLIYHSTCFSMLQNEIDQAFIKASSNAQDHGILKTLMPFPIFFINHGISLYLILFMILLSVLFNVFNLIRVRIEIMSSNFKFFLF